MTTTLIAIFLALQTAPLIAIAITIPFAAFHYAKNKVLNVRWFTYFYIFVLYFAPNVDLLSTELCDALHEMGVPHESVTKARLMTEGVMLDWITNGLAEIPCELRLDKRYHGNMLMLSVSGENKSNVSLEDSYADMLKGLNLTIETYYAAEKNICNILIP